MNWSVILIAIQEDGIGSQLEGETTIIIGAIINKEVKGHVALAKSKEDG